MSDQDKCSIGVSTVACALLAVGGCCCVYQEAARRGCSHHSWLLPRCRGEPQPSDVTFKLSELISQPENSFSPIATFQTLVQVR